MSIENNENNINLLQTKLSFLSRELSQNTNDINSTSSRMETSIFNIQNSIINLNKLMLSSADSDLKVTIENDRKLANSNIQLLDSKIENINTDVFSVLETKASNTNVNMKVSNIKTEADIKINNNFTQLINTISDLKVDLLNQETKLSYLILNKDELNSKLNIIASITNLGTKENLDIINDIKNKNKATNDSVTQLNNYFSKLKINLDIQIKTLEDILAAQDEKLINELTERKFDVKHLQQDMSKIEIRVSGTLEALRKEMDEFTTILDKKETAINIRFDEIIKIVNTNYTKINDFVINESKNRINSNNNLDIKISNFVTQFNTDLNKINYDKEIITLQNNLDKNIEKIDELNLDNLNNFSKLFKDLKLNQRSTEVLQENLLAKMSNVEIALTDNYEALTDKLETVTDNTENKLTKLSKFVSKLEDKLITLEISSRVPGSTDKLTNVIESNILNDQISSIQDKVSELLVSIDKTNADMISNKAHNLTLINNKNLRISNKVSEAMLIAETALKNVSTNNVNLESYINTIQNQIIDIMGGANLDIVDLQKLNTKVTTLNTKLINDLDNLTNQLNISNAGIDLRFINLERDLEFIKDNLITKTEETDTKLQNIIKEFSENIVFTGNELNTIKNNIDTNITLITNNAIKDANTLKLLAEEMRQKDNLLQNNIESSAATLSEDINANTILVNNISDRFSEVQKQLSNDLNYEANTRNTEVENLNDLINKEIIDRQDNCTDLLNKITVQRKKLESVLDNSSEAFDSLKEIMDYINKLSGEKENMFTNLVNTVSNLETNLNKSLEEEVKNRKEDTEKTLKVISNESSARIENVKKLTNSLNEEVKNRLNDIQVVQSNIDKQEINFNNTIDSVNNTIVELEKAGEDTTKVLENDLNKLGTTLNEKVLELKTDTLNLKNELISTIDTLTSVVGDNLNTNNINNKNRINDIKIINSTLDQFFGNYPKGSNTMADMYNSLDVVNNSLTEKIKEESIKAINDNNILEKETKNLVKVLNERIDTNIDNINIEEASRISSDKKIENDLNSTNNTITKLDSVITGKINTETQERKNNDNILTNSLNTEISTRSNQNKSALEKIELVNKSLNSKTDKINKTIKEISEKEISDYNNNLLKIDNEITDRKNYDAVIDKKLADEINRSITKDIELEALSTKNEKDISRILQDSDSSIDSFKEVQDTIIEKDKAINSKLESTNAKFAEENKIITDKLDMGISTRITEVQDLNTLVNTEIHDRKVSIDNVSKNLNDFVIKQEVENTNISNKINIEVQERLNNEKDIREDINKEVGARAKADQDIKNTLNKETSDRIKNEGDLSLRIQSVSKATESFVQDLKNEKDERISKDGIIAKDLKELTENIDKIFEGSTEDLNSFKEIVNLIKSTDFGNDNNLINFSKTVYTSIDNLHSLLSKEESVRSANDNIIQTKLNNEIRERLYSLQEIVNKFEDNKVQVSLLNSTFKDDVVKVIDKANKETDNIISGLNSEFNNIKNLISAVNKNIGTEIQDRIFYTTELRNDLELFIKNSTERYGIITDNLTNAIHKIESNEILLENDLENKIQDQNKAIHLTEQKIINNTDLVNNKTDENKSLIKVESNQRVNEDTKLSNEINLNHNKILNITNSLDTDIKNLDERVQKILDGSSVDLEEFQKIVNVLNTIDPNTDIIRNIKDDINFKIAIVNSDKIKDKILLETEIRNIKDIALGLINTQEERYSHSFNKLRNELLSSLRNTRNINKLDIDTLNVKLDNEITSKKDFYKAVSSYMDIKLQNEKTLRVSEDNNLNLRMIKETSTRQEELLTLRKELNTNIELQEASNADKFITLSNTITKEINNRTFVTSTITNTVNEFINTNTSNINNFTNDITKKLDLYHDLVGNGLDNYSDITSAIKDSIVKLETIQDEVYNSIKLDIENGNIVGISSGGSSDENTNDSSNLSRIDTQSLLNTMDARINDVVIQEANRAQTRELDIEAKIINIKTDVTLDTKENTRLITDVKNSILTAVDSKIKEFENITDNLENRIDDLIHNMNSENDIRRSDSTLVHSEIDQANNSIKNTTEKLNKFIERTDNTNSTIFDDTKNYIDNLTGTLNKDFNILNNDISTRNKTLDAKLKDFQDMLLSLNNDGSSLHTELQNIKNVLDNMLSDTEVNLDSLSEVVNFIKENDTELLEVQTSIINGIGLDIIGGYTPFLNSHYLNNITTIRSSLDKLDEIIYENEVLTENEFKALKAKLDNEITKRIDDIKQVNARISQVNDTLQDQISHNLLSIDKNTVDIFDNRKILDKEITERLLVDKQVQVSVGLEKNNSLVIKNANYIKSKSVKNSLLDLDESVFNINKDLQQQIGNLDDLETENKDDLVQAINETLNLAKYPNFGSVSSFNDAFILQNL